MPIRRPGFSPMPIPDRLAAALDRRRLPHHAILSPYTCLLIESGRHVALVDTGGGASSRTTGAIVARLEMAGIRPRDVDTVILTHAHPDHIGGAVGAGGRPVFSERAPRALGDGSGSFGRLPHPDLTRACACPREVQCVDGGDGATFLSTLQFQIETVDKETEVIPGRASHSRSGPHAGPSRAADCVGWRGSVEYRRRGRSPAAPGISGTGERVRFMSGDGALRHGRNCSTARFPSRCGSWRFTSRSPASAAYAPRSDGWLRLDAVKAAIFESLAGHRRSGT